MAAAEPSDPIAQAWDKVDRAWDDPDAHRRFIALCRALGDLPEAGRRYREVRDGDPGRRASAEARIGELLAAATLELEAHRSRPPSAPDRRRLTWTGLLVMVVSIAALAYALAAVGG